MDSIGPRLTGSPEERDLVAMMAYLASEDPNTVPRARRVAPTTGRNVPPTCHRALRSFRESIAPRPPA